MKRARVISLMVAVSVLVGEVALVPSNPVSAGPAPTVEAPVAPASVPVSSEPPAAGQSTAGTPDASAVRAPVNLSTPTETSSQPNAGPDSNAVAAPGMPAARTLTGFDAKTSVEELDLRTQFSKTYRNVDGTETLVQSSAPVHYRTSSGSWADVDNRVVRDGLGRLTNAANDWSVTFEPMTSGKGVGITTADGNVRFVGEGAAAVTPTVEPDGESVRYPNVYPGMDIVYRVTGGGVEELLVLKQPTATPAVSFRFDGLNLDMAPGQLKGRGTSKLAKRLTVSAPETFDSAGKPVDVAQQVFTVADITTGSSRVKVGMSGTAVAATPAARFPLTVDPNVSLTPSTMTAYANYTNNGTSYATYSDGYARVGNPYLSSTSTVRWRTALQIDYNLLWNSSITAATLTTNVVDGTTNGARSLKVFWGSQMGFHYSVAPRSYNQTSPPAAAATSGWTKPYLVDTISAGVENLTGSNLKFLYNNFTRLNVPITSGTLLLQGDESAAYTMKKFTVSLSLTFNRWPATPTATVSTGKRPLVFGPASGTDPDSDALQFRYRYWDDVNANGVVDTYESGWTAWGTGAGNTTVALPAAWTGDQIRTYVDSWDGILFAGEYHVSTKEFALQTVVNTAPPTPTLVSPATGTQQHPLTVALTAATVTDANADALTYTFFRCTDATCSTGRTYLTGTPTVTGSQVSQTVTFTTSFYGQQIFWGVEVSDSVAVVRSATRSITFTNAPPIATNVTPVDGANLLFTPAGATGNPLPKLTAVVSDTDDLTINFQFQITPVDGSGVLVTSPYASVTQASLGTPTQVQFQLPAWLESSKGYRWTVLVNDTAAGSGASPISTLTTRSRLGNDPVAPMQSVGGAQINLATGNIVVSAGGGKSIATVGGPLSVGFTYNSQDTSTLGMRGTYYVDGNGNHAPDPGEERLIRTDPYPAFNWDVKSPAETLPADFEVRWESALLAPVDGDWQFAVEHDEHADVAISMDGGPFQTVYTSDNPVSTGAADVFATASPTTITSANRVKIRVNYRDTSGTAFVGLRAQVSNSTSNGEYALSNTWFTPNDSRSLPTGWTFSADSGVDPAWASSRLNGDNLTLTTVDGSTIIWRRTTTATGTAWTTPDETDDVVTVNPDGTVIVLGSDGLTYRFAVDGHLDDVATTADDLQPAGGRRVYASGGSDPSLPLKLTRLEDRLATTRAINLFYNQTGLNSGCATPPAGYDTAPPAGMLCAIAYPDGTATYLYYQQGLLARISDPGDETGIGMAAAPEGRAVTDFVWTQGRLSSFRTPSNSDRVNAQALTPSPIPTAQQIPQQDLDTEFAWTPAGNQLTVTLPRPNANDPRPATTIAFTPPTATVRPAGMTVDAREVRFDAAGRTTKDIDAVRRSTDYTWATNSDMLLKTVSGGRTSSTVYDSQWHPTDTYGPAANSCFTTTPPPVGTEYTSYPPVAACANAMPHSRTEYDHNIQGLQGAYTATAGTPMPNTSHAMGPNAQGNVDYTWTGAPTGLTTVDNWTATFTGNIIPTTTGSYAFRLTAGATDTATLYVDDVAMVKVQPGASDLAAGAVSLTAGTVHRVRIAYTAGTGTSTLKLGWTPNGGTLTYALGAQLKPGFWYATRTTIDDTTGSTQIPATHVTETRYNDGIDPVYGIASTTVEDPNGLALTTRETYEPVGANSLLRRTRRTLPAYAANVNPDNSTNYDYYAANAAVANPCVAGSPAVDQARLPSTTTSAKAADGTTIGTVTVYDILGRPVASRYADATAWTCTTYDARGRVTAVSIPANATTPNGRTITTTYAVAGDPYTTATTDGTGTTLPTTTVDALGRAVTTVDVWGVTTTTSYDRIGRTSNEVTAIASPSYSSTTEYTWDDAGRQTTQTLDGKTIAQLTYRSDTAPLDPGVLETVTYPAAGTSTAGNGTKGTFTYDNLGRIAGLAWEGPGGTPITSDTVTRALGGNILTDTIDGALAWTYTYDSVSRLTRAVGSGHDYQYGFANTIGCTVNPSLNTVTNTAAGANSNRATLTDNASPVAAYCYDQADRLLATSQAGYTGAINYDAHGNTTLLAGDTSIYDYANRHMSTQHGATLVTYTRDSSDAIVARVDTSDASNIRYGDNGLVMTTANTVTERTLTLPGGTLLTQRSSGDIWSYPNVHGDIAATCTSAGVKQGLTFRFDPFGGVSLLPDNSAGNLDFGWAGQVGKGAEHSPDLAAVIEMGSRVYSPQLGRFEAVDPIEGGTPNSYTYPNDPINDSDLNGNICWSCAVRHVANAAKAVVTNPVFQVVATVAACFTPACTAVAAGFAAVNTYTRVQRRGGWSKAVRSGSFWAATALDVATVFVPRVVPVSSVVADESVAAMSRYGRPIKSAAGFLTSRARSWTALTNLVKVSAVGSARYSACRGLRMGC